MMDNKDDFNKNNDAHNDDEQEHKMKYFFFVWAETLFVKGIVHMLKLDILS